MSSPVPLRKLKIFFSLLPPTYGIPESKSSLSPLIDAALFRNCICASMPLLDDNLEL
jgi:hypothetical protein